ncbi:MAG: ATP phosphoribosyltransferase [Chloroflexi bacterium]|nr:ATP phosphoribosyltransferase [Chloroflexota bacterium]
MTETLRLVIPSSARMEDETVQFLAACGLPVKRTNPRQYRASIGTLPEVEITFQRASDIYARVHEGTVDLGITGYDVVAEYQREDDEVFVVMRELGYGHCALVLAVPESWVDVTSVHDLSEIAADWRSQARELRVATGYPNLTRQFLYDHGINYFSLVDSGGALEAAPSLGYAEIIADITSSGVTLRENRLKPVGDGTILAAEACLIANRAELGKSPAKLELTRRILESMEAYLRARTFVSVTANVQGETVEAVARQVMAHPEIAGLRGPTIARVYAKPPHDDEDWYAVTVIVARKRLQDAVDAFRRAGAADMTAVELAYTFEKQAWSYEGLLRAVAGTHQVPATTP